MKLKRHNTHTLWAGTLLLMVLTNLTACGQKGPLYLPTAQPMPSPAVSGAPCRVPECAVEEQQTESNAESPNQEKDK